jgi:hypothetical protein
VAVGLVCETMRTILAQQRGGGKGPVTGG